MLNKRSVIALLAAGLLAACSDVTDIDRAKSDTGNLKLNAVRIDTSNMSTTSSGRDISVTRTQLASDLSAALSRELGLYSDPNGLPADVNVAVEELYLANIVDRALVGTSYIDSTISVSDAATGEIIIAPTAVRGDSEQLRGGGLLGVATTKTVEEDYQLAIQGYAEALAASLVASKQ